VRSLSGGERNRLLLARLFARPANVLVLDEPTNDLDIDTLELLEELLQNYDGTVFLVSHDRAFLDNVVTSTIAFEGDAHWREYEGGVQDWLTQSNRAKAWAAQTQTIARKQLTPPAKPAAVLRCKPKPLALKKLSFKEQREYDSLPGLIEQLEAEQAKLNRLLADGSLYVSDPKKAADMAVRITQIDDEMLTAMERWETLGQRVTV
jgi:ABC transport system ATP-binding/permease protein